jgi:anti-anti-sigma factor
MHIDFLIEGEIAILQLEGRFSTGSDAEFLRTKEELAESGKRLVAVDCSQVPYLDSTALNFLVGLYTAAKDAGGRFALCGLNPRMREVLRITHLDEILPIYATRQIALAALAQPAERNDRAAEG